MLCVPVGALREAPAETRSVREPALQCEQSVHVLDGLCDIEEKSEKEEEKRRRVHAHGVDVVLQPVPTNSLFYFLKTPIERQSPISRTSVVGYPRGPPIS